MAHRAMRNKKGAASGKLTGDLKSMARESKSHWRTTKNDTAYVSRILA